MKYSRTTLWRRRKKPAPQYKDGKIITATPDFCYRVAWRYYAWLVKKYPDDVRQVIEMVLLTTQETIGAKKLARQVSRALYHTARELGYRKMPAGWIRNEILGPVGGNKLPV